MLHAEDSLVFKEIAKAKISTSSLLNLEFIKSDEEPSARQYTIGENKYDFKKPITKSQFLVERMKSLLGLDWILNELRKPSKNQHFMVKCLREFNASLTKAQLERQPFSNGGLEIKPNGFSMEVLLLARDLCILEHCGFLDKAYLKRLKNKKEYQGVRYELTVATICSILGLELTATETPLVKGEQIVEFTAYHKETNTTLYVEAKSRERKGVFHSQITDQPISNESEFKGLINKILKKRKRGQTLIGFIDVNMHDAFLGSCTPQGFDNTIMQSIRKAMAAPSIGRDDHANAIVFTNYGYHYSREKIGTPGIFEILSPELTNPSLVENKINIPHFYDMLYFAIQHYPLIPKPKQ